jgi:hypothetical protein
MLQFKWGSIRAIARKEQCGSCNVRGVTQKLQHKRSDARIEMWEEQCESYNARELAQEDELHEKNNTKGATTPEK